MTSTPTPEPTMPETESEAVSGVFEDFSGNQTPLWCVHVIGADDVYAAPDVITAVKWAHRTNVMVAERSNSSVRIADDDYVLCFANVELWPWSPEKHAESLPRAIQGMSTPAELATPRPGAEREA